MADAESKGAESETESMCQSCGEEAKLASVTRVYVTPETWESKAAVNVAQEEFWCETCRAHYPHLAADEAV